MQIGTKMHEMGFDSSIANVKRFLKKCGCIADLVGSSVTGCFTKLSGGKNYIRSGSGKIIRSAVSEVRKARKAIA